MKRIFITSAVALALVLGSAGSAQAQNYYFAHYLTVGSTGTDVVQLQTWLIANGFDIPAITMGAAAKGYFGQQTKSAVIRYQTSVGLPSTGFVGPLTLAKLNGSAGVTINPPVCPQGYTCTAIPGTTVPCPVGYTCTPLPGTPPLSPNPANPSQITTPGIPGSLDVSLQSSPSGATLDKGQEADVASFKLKAGDSDMAISSIAVDFNNRMWLYANRITLLDGSTVIAQRSNLTSADFTELTVGTSYRLRFNSLNYIQAKSSTHYITVRIQMLPSTDRTAATGAGRLAITGFEVRSTDGTGVTLTSNASGVGSDTGLTNCGSVVCRAFSFSGGNVGQIVPALSSSQPATRLVQISTSGTTDGVVLGRFSLKSESRASTLRSLIASLQLHTNGNVASTIPNIFNTISLVVGSQTVANGSIGTPVIVGADSTAALTFTDFNVNLPADVYTDVSIIGKVSQNTSNQYDGVIASTTLVGNTTNIHAEDSGFNTVPVNAVTLNSNLATLTSSPVVAWTSPNPPYGTTYGSTIVNSTLGNTTQQFQFNFALSAGNNPIYVSKTANVALSTTTSGGLTITPVNFSADDTNGDGTTYFYVGPNQTKVFHSIYSASGSTTSSGTVIVTQINYGTTTTALTGGALNQTDIANNLKAVLFH